jgi:hypothetical protein
MLGIPSLCGRNVSAVQDQNARTDLHRVALPQQLQVPIKTQHRPVMSENHDHLLPKVIYVSNLMPSGPFTELLGNRLSEPAKLHWLAWTLWRLRCSAG